MQLATGEQDIVVLGSGVKAGSVVVVTEEILGTSPKTEIPLPKSADESSLPYVSSSLTVNHDPSKGRHVVSTTHIRDGEVLMIEAPYALVPAMTEDEPPYQICSRHECSERLSSQQARVPCHRNCASEVVWCDDQCRSQDAARHSIECSWLRKHSTNIRDTYNDSAFGLLWLILRILTRKHQQQQMTSTTQNANDLLVSHFGMKGWDSMWNLEGSTDFFPVDTIERWRQYASDYLTDGSLHEISISVGEIVDIICKVELNSFGLYPGITGEYPVIDFVGRGDYYGGGIYPTAAMFNHSCCPSVSSHHC